MNDPSSAGAAPNTEHDVRLEATHAPSSDPLWQESWYFNFVDAAAGVYGLARIGYRPSTGKAEGAILAFVDGRREVLYAATGCALDSADATIDPPRLLATKSLRFRCEAPLSRWTLFAQTSRLRVSLVFDAMTPAHVFPSMHSSTASAASDHYEQSGRVHGTLRIGENERTIEGRGQRDHSWGPRDYSGVGEWTWLSAQFESGWSMNWWSVGKDGTLTGFVGHRDRTVAVVGGGVTWLGDADGISPSGALVRLELADGSRKEIRMQVEARWPFFKEGATVVEFACTYECEGEKGAGISERLLRESHPVRRHLPELPTLVRAMLRAGR